MSEETSLNSLIQIWNNLQRRKNIIEGEFEKSNDDMKKMFKDFYFPIKCKYL